MGASGRRGATPGTATAHVSGDPQSDLKRQGLSPATSPRLQHSQVLHGRAGGGGGGGGCGGRLPGASQLMSLSLTADSAATREE